MTQVFLLCQEEARRAREEAEREMREAAEDPISRGTVAVIHRAGAGFVAAGNGHAYKVGPPSYKVVEISLLTGSHPSN